MALTQINKLMWIVDTISKARRISFNDLNEKWMDEEDLSGGVEMSKRTFHKWILSIQDNFGLFIDCEKGGEYRYYINNLNDLKYGSIEQWMLNTISVSNTLASSKSIKDRILLEDVPSGEEYLDKIIDAMKQNRLIHITYYNYWRGDERQHFVMPLCVKLFRQRWYFVGRYPNCNFTTVFCLDRIRDFRLSSHSFEYPDDFSPKEFFNGYFGVIVGDKVPLEKVQLKVSAGQANYLRDLPIHSGNQKEVERNGEYSIFELTIHPTFDFQQEILWNGDDIEVLSPDWLRKEIAGKIERMNNKYKEEK